MSDEEQAQPMTEEHSILLDNIENVNRCLRGFHQRPRKNWTAIHFLEAKKADFEARLLKLNTGNSDE